MVVGSKENVFRAAAQRASGRRRGLRRQTERIRDGLADFQSVASRKGLDWVARGSLLTISMGQGLGSREQAPERGRLCRGTYGDQQAHSCPPCSCSLHRSAVETGPLCTNRKRAQIRKKRGRYRSGLRSSASEQFRWLRHQQIVSEPRL